MEANVAPGESRETDLKSGAAAVPATVRALGWTSFLTDFSSEAIYPLLPGFVKGLGGTSLEIGLIDGIANAVAALVRLPSGRVSDAIGRRPLVLFGYGLSALVRPLMALVVTPPGAIVVRMADRFGKGIRSAPRDALVTDLVAPAHRGRAFGHIRAMDHAGAALGPLAAMLFLLFFPGRERLLFGLALIPGLLTLAMIWSGVRDPLRATPAAPRTALEPGLTRQQACLLCSVGVWALGAASEHFLLLRAGDLGTPSAAVPLVWFAISLAKSGAAAAAGRLLDHAPPRRMLAVGWMIFAIAYVGLAQTSLLWPSLALMLVVGVGCGLAEPAERALVADLTADAHQGNAFGWYTLVQGLMSLPAGLLAGWLWQRDATGPAASFTVTAFLAAVACSILVAAVRPPQESPPITTT